MIIMSSFSSVVPQSRPHVSVLSKLISADSMDTRLWLKGEIVRLVDPMLDALFLRLIMSPSSAEHQHSLTVSELCQLIEGEKEETNRLVRGEMDRLVNSLFFRLANKLLVNMDWAGSGHVGDSLQVMNPSHQVESPNTESHQIVHIPQPSTFNSYLQQPHSIGVEWECNQQILTGVNRELEDGENEMVLETNQDNATQTNQFCTGPSSTVDHHLFHQMNSSLEDGRFSNQMNDATDNDTQHDWDELDIEEGNDERMKHIEEEVEEIVDGSDHDEEVGDDDTEIDSDNDEEDEDSQDEESFRFIASPPQDTTSPPNHSPIKRQSVRNVKRKQTEEEQQNEMANRDIKYDEEEENFAEKVTSGSVKRLRSSRLPISSRTQQKQIIPQPSEEIATECTTNLTQPNLAQLNRHFHCSHCHKSFERKTDFKRHLRVHTGERPFQCDQCHKGFSQSGDLKRHQLIHQNIKRFRCHECDKQFTLKRNLDSHLLTHSGERPFECRHCAKSFTKSGTRTKHEQAIHLHVKPYRCKQCGHTATQRSDLITHIRLVHFGLPQSIKEQQALNIIDNRDPGELVEKV